MFPSLVKRHHNTILSMNDPPPRQFVPEDAFKIRPSRSSGDRAYPLDPPSVCDFVWKGERHTASFDIQCLPGVAPQRVPCKASIVEGTSVKHLWFGIEVVGPDVIPRSLGGGPNEERLDCVMEEEKDKVPEIPFEELEFVRRLGNGVQVRRGESRGCWLWWWWW